MGLLNKMSKEGFENEREICKELNGRKFMNLNENLTHLIKWLFPDIGEKDKIICTQEGGANKSDLLINVENKKFKNKRISVKKGSGNSVHQESIEDFLVFLEKEFKVNQKFKADLQFFIWGDYTQNGSGNRDNRMSAVELEKKFPELIRRIKIFMNHHRRTLIYRFVIIGSKSTSAPDAIYYGDKNKGIWADSKKILDFLSESKSRSVIPVGGLTFQAWNRAIKKDGRSEHKRGVIQLKWPSIKKDLSNLMEIIK